MIAHGLYSVNRDVHRTHDRTGAVGLAGRFRAFDRENTEQVRESQHRAVRTGVLAPWALYEESESKCEPKDCECGPGHLAAPEVEEGEVRVIVCEDERATGGCDVDHPRQHQVAGVAQDVVDAGWHEMVITSPKQLFTPFGNPLLNSPQRTDPAAKNWSKQDGQHETDHHQYERRFVDLLHERADCSILVNGYHAAERT